MATLSDIAAHAGVSRTTAAYILRGKRQQVGIKAETERRVRAAADALGYRPNASARALSAGRFGNIALLVSTNSERSYLPENLLFGIHDRLADLGQRLIFVRMPDASLTDEEFTPNVLREWTADGLLVNYTHEIPERMLTLLDQYPLPVIWINTSRPTDTVIPDDQMAGRMAAERLFTLGHRRIAFVTHPTTHHSSAERWRGVQEAAGAAGGQTEYWEYDLTSRNPAVAEWLPMVLPRLTAPDRPTAFIAYASYIAHPLLHLLTRAGFRVPQDFSLVSIHDRSDNALGVALTTVILPETEIGRTAVEMAQRKIEAPEVPLPTRALPVWLEPGVSCGPPP